MAAVCVSINSVVATIRCHRLPHYLQTAQSGRILYPREKWWKILSSLGIRLPERTRQSGPLDISRCKPNLGPVTWRPVLLFTLLETRIDCLTPGLFIPLLWRSGVAVWRCGGAALENMVPLLLAFINRFPGTDYSSITFRASQAREQRSNKKIVEGKCD